MDEQLRALKDRISQMSDDELLQIVEVEYDDYRKEAIEFAEAELQQRNIPYEQPELDEGLDEEDEDEGEQLGAIVSTVGVAPCDACGGKMRACSLYADKELSAFFPDKNEERFIQALACGDCGSLKLFVDFKTDVEG